MLAGPDGAIDLAEARNTLLLAIVAAEGLVGEARVRLDAAYALGDLRPW